MAIPIFHGMMAVNHIIEEICSSIQSEEIKLLQYIKQHTIIYKIKGKNLNYD